MNTPQMQSPFYREKPVFGGSPTQRRPKLEGKMGLLVFALLTLALAAASGFLYLQRGKGVSTSVEGGVPAGTVPTQSVPTESVPSVPTETTQPATPVQ